jgi:tryptophan halogenase
VGIHERLFVKNVCAIGLAAGFIEPLESNGLLSVHEFLFNLIQVLKRGKITQWDRDNFNFSCKTFFDQFTEFVALHYALSQRTDTPYWQDISNKSFYTNRLTESELKLTMSCYMDRFNFFKSDAGTHYISTGMNYLGTGQVDKEISPQFRHILQVRKNELKKWNNICKNKKSLLNFLKDTICKI